MPNGFPRNYVGLLHPVFCGLNRNFLAWPWHWLAYTGIRIAFFCSEPTVIISSENCSVLTAVQLNCGPECVVKLDVGFPPCERVVAFIEQTGKAREKISITIRIRFYFCLIEEFLTVLISSLISQYGKYQTWIRKKTYNDSRLYFIRFGSCI